MVDSRLERARNALAAAELKAGVHRRELKVVPEEQSGEWPVPPALSPLLPRGLSRGMSLGFHGSRIAGFLAAGIASSAGAWGIFLGMPDIGWAFASRMGVDLSHSFVIPSVPDGVKSQVLATAIDGFDVVMLGWGLHLDSRERRVLSRRALTRNTLLLGEGWDCKDRLDGRITGVNGVRSGYGHISEIEVELSGNGHQCALFLTSAGWDAREKAEASRLRIVKP